MSLGISSYDMSSFPSFYHLPITHPNRNPLRKEFIHPLGEDLHDHFYGNASTNKPRAIPQYSQAGHQSQPPQKGYVRVHYTMLKSTHS